MMIKSPYSVQDTASSRRPRSVSLSPGDYLRALLFGMRGVLLAAGTKHSAVYLVK